MNYVPHPPVLHLRSTQAAFVISVAFALLACLLILPTPSNAIQITGGHAIASIGPVSTDSLMFSAVGYNDGFSMFADGVADPVVLSLSGVDCRNHFFFGTDHRCAPGVQIPLSLNYNTTRAAGLFMGGPRFATLGDANYSLGGCFPTCPPGSAYVFGTFFTADIIAPPFQVGPTFTLQEPFAFLGSFTHFDPQAVTTEPLVGNGTVTLNLFQSTCGIVGGGIGGGAGSCNNILAWEMGSLSYDFAAPTPEPTTLLLWGTSAAGLGLARWRRRRARALVQATRQRLP